MLTVNSPLRLMNSLVPSSGIDQPVARPLRTHRVKNVSGFFGEDRYFRRDPGQRLNDNSMRGQVGKGERGIVRFAGLAGIATAIDFHDGCSGAMRNVYNLLQVCCVHGWLSCHSNFRLDVPLL